MKWCKHEKKRHYNAGLFFDVCALTNGACTGPYWWLAPCPSFEPEACEMVVEGTPTMKKEYFELRKEHLRLLRYSYVRWQKYGRDGYGAAAIDPKTPYGNSFILDDLAEILGGDLPLDELMKLHRETETALQICLTTQSFEPGLYEREWLGEWKRVKKVKITITKLDEVEK